MAESVCTQDQQVQRHERHGRCLRRPVWSSGRVGAYRSLSTVLVTSYLSQQRLPSCRFCDWLAGHWGPWCRYVSRLSRTASLLEFNMAATSNERCWLGRTECLSGTATWLLSSICPLLIRPLVECVFRVVHEDGLHCK